MNIAYLVDRGIELRKEIKERETELAGIEIQLEQAALDGEQVDLNDADREGKQFLAHGTTATVPIVLTADLIVGQFADDSPVHVRLKEIAGEKLKEFFRKKTIWENLAKSGKQFRSLAASLLAEKAAAFITAAISRNKDGIPKSQIKIEWDRTDTRS